MTALNLIGGVIFAFGVFSGVRLVLAVVWVARRGSHDSFWSAVRRRARYGDSND